MSWNKRMLTVEDANSIIKHFNKGFCDYYTLDTSELTTEDTWFAWDFIDVYRVTGSISFSVKNSLWTGGFRVIDCNVSNPTVSVSNGTITVSKTGLEWCVLVLELSPEFNHGGSIFELDYQVEYTPVIRPFYEDLGLTMGFLDGSEPVVGMEVSDVVTGETLTTDNDGLVTVIAPMGKAGDYDYVLEAENNGEIVTYNFPYTRIQAELPVILLNPTVYRDKVNLLEFKFLFDTEYTVTEEMLFGDNHIRLRCDGVYYELKEYNGDTFTFEVPIGLNTNSNMVLEVNGNDYIDNYSVELNVATSYVTVDTAYALDIELSSDNPAGVIEFTGEEFESEVTVGSDVTIRFTDDVVSSLGNVFTVSEGCSLIIDGVNFTGGQLVSLTDANVSVVNSSFQHCTSSIIKGTGVLRVEDSSFIDNYSCLDIDGDISLLNCLFDLSDTDYLDTGNPAFIRCFNDLTVDYCQFNLDLHGLSSLGLSYVMFYLGRDGTVNQVSNRNLLKNDVFPVAKNTGTVDVESEHYHINSKDNKCMVWTVEDTNTVYSNHLEVEYVQ